MSPASHKLCLPFPSSDCLVTSYLQAMLQMYFVTIFDGNKTEGETDQHNMAVNKDANVAMESKDSEKSIDLYRDTPIRLLGYSNEVGESFRAIVHVNVVRASYAVAFGYVLADTMDKVKKADKVLNSDDSRRNVKLMTCAADTLVWQTLASVAIPGFTINRICASSLYLLKKHSKLPSATRKWTTVAVGLGSIPFIVKPIDHLVDALMNNTFRKWFS